MNVREMYRHIILDTDPSDPVVAEEIKQAMRQSDGWTDIHAHLLRLRHHASGNVLEIGVHWGISTVALLLGVEEKGGHLWSVDVSKPRVEFTHPDWTFIEAHSDLDRAKIKQTIPKNLDLLFIDGDHSYKAVLADLMNYGEQAHTIMLHDAREQDVHLAILDYLEITPKQCTLYPRSHGLAVLE